MATGFKSGGRKAGVLNKSTAKSKAEFDNMLSGEMKHVAAAFKEVREESKSKYLDLLSKFLPYLYAKKTDITSDGESITGFKIESVRDADNNKAK